MANAEVSSAALIELKEELNKLSKCLHETYDSMNADLSHVEGFWRDSKYEEFRNNYTPQINACENISVRYNEWCTKVLDPKIGLVENLEKKKMDINEGGGTSSGGSSSGGDRKVVDRPKTTPKPEAENPTPPKPRPSKAPSINSNDGRPSGGRGSGRNSPRGNSAQTSNRPSPIHPNPKGPGRR